MPSAATAEVLDAEGWFKTGDVAVIDPDGFVRIVASKLFVVPRAGGVTVEELKAYCKENFTGYKVPKQIVLRDSLPMTPVGKILRRELRDPA